LLCFAKARFLKYLQLQTAAFIRTILEQTFFTLSLGFIRLSENTFRKKAKQVQMGNTRTNEQAHMEEERTLTDKFGEWLETMTSVSQHVNKGIV
jgi:hypothetical protein